MNQQAVTEKQFMQAVIDLARLCGWLVYHTHDSRRSEPGFPDLVLAKRGQPLLCWELKRVGGKPTPAQTVWLGTLASATGIRTDVLWPCEAHWRYIEEVLRRGYTGVGRSPTDEAERDARALRTVGTALQADDWLRAIRAFLYQPISANVTEVDVTCNVQHVQELAFDRED